MQVHLISTPLLGRLGSLLKKALNLCERVGQVTGIGVSSGHWPTHGLIRDNCHACTISGLKRSRLGVMSIPGIKCTGNFSFLLHRTFKAGQLSQDPVVRQLGDDAITGGWGEYDFESEARDERQQKDTNLYQFLYQTMYSSKYCLLGKLCSF